MIVNKLSIVKMEILLNMGKQLAKACGLSSSITAVFGGLPIVIVMGDFYQFLLIAGCSLWGEPQTNDNHNSKTLWLSFSSFITLIQQMYQQNDPNFTQLWRQVHIGKWTYDDVAMFHGKVVIVLILNDPLKNIVIVQRNKTRHPINCLQIERFAQSVGHDIIIFPAQHSRTKREKRKNIFQKNLFSIQDRDHGAIGPGLLYYCK